MVRKRRNATKARAQPRPGQLLGRLQAGEAAQVLRALLARHPWREFGHLLTTHAGWGMRIVFVPVDELDEEPRIEIREAAE
jgi:hypothetical protein